jgi:programmed cell death 6-interacting protein
LTPILLKFQTKVDDFVFARKTEKDDLMKDIQTSITRAPTPSQAPARPPPPIPPTASGKNI